MGGKTSNESKSKYRAKAYDRIEITVKKGFKETLQEYTSKTGESVNSFINRAIIEAMEKDSDSKILNEQNKS